MLYHKIPETKYPKMRIIEVQGPTRGGDGQAIVTLETYLTPDFVEWLKKDGGIGQEYINRLENWLNVPILDEL